MDTSKDEINNSSTKGEYFIQNDEEGYRPSNTPGLNVSVINLPDDQTKQNDTTEVTIPVHDPDDIIPRLTRSYTMQTLHTVLLLTLCTIALMIATAICFIFAMQNSIKGFSKVEPIICGSILGMISICFLLFVCTLYFSILKGFNWIKRAKKIIEIDGTIWQSQVDSVRNLVPGETLRPCLDILYNRLRKRSNGYILFADDGFIIDELNTYQYEVTYVVRVDVMNNPMEKGWIIRVLLVISGEMKYGFRKGNYLLMPVDLYMPPSMHIDEVNEIRQMIFSNSYEYLLESRFLDKPKVRPQC